MSATLLERLDGHRIGFGTMRLCGEGCWGWPDDRAGALAVLRRAVELGTRLIDTADCYGPDVAEELVAEALHPYGDDVVVATKAGVRHPGPGQWIPDARPERLRACCEDSLRRLRVDRIDVLQLHTVDPEVPFEESVGALAQLVDEGTVGAVGLSNVTVEQLDAANEITPIASVQNRYHLLDRGSETVLRRCEELGVTFMAWRPLAMVNDDMCRAIEAAAPGMDVPTASLAWLLQRSPVMCPVPGTSQVRNVEHNLAAVDVQLDASTLAALDALVTD